MEDRERQMLSYKKDSWDQIHQGLDFMLSYLNFIS